MDKTSLTGTLSYSRSFRRFFSNNHKYKDLSNVKVNNALIRPALFSQYFTAVAMNNVKYPILMKEWST